MFEKDIIITGTHASYIKEMKEVAEQREVKRVEFLEAYLKKFGYLYACTNYGVFKQSKRTKK